MKSPCLYHDGPGEPCPLLNENKKNDTCDNCARRNEYNKHNDQNPFPDGMTYTKGKDQMTEKEITKTCKGEDCPCGDDPQPIANFDVNKTSKQPFRLCRVCRAQKAEKKASWADKGQAVKKVKANVVKDAMADLAYKEIVSHADPDNDPDLPPGDIKKTPKEFGLGDEALKTSEAASALASSAMDAISADASIIDWAALRDTNIYKIEIDFSNHPEVLQDLVEMAARDLRDPDKQALFILRHIYEKGLKIAEVDETIN